MIMHKTEAGKELETYTDPLSANFRFRWTTGGELPAVLEGLFTDHIQLQRALDRYLAPAENPAQTFEPKAEQVETGFIDKLTT